MIEEVPALVIGAGPAGLMAAEVLTAAGHRVVIADAMPSPARKFLMAGKSGLNLTKDEPAGAFAARVAGGSAAPVPDAVPVASWAENKSVTPSGGKSDSRAVSLSASFRGDQEPREHLNQEKLRLIVKGFGPAEVMAWARGLGIELFAGSTGRVFPVGMKASPLLRAWLGRLAAQGAELRLRWRWQGFAAEGMGFDTPDGPKLLRAGATVLALGGASWPRLGSDAAWVPWLRAAGVAVAPFRPANMGFRVDWSAAMAPLQGAAVKGTRLSAGPLDSRGEWVVTAAGIEGGAVYEISAALRDGAEGRVDLMPDLGAEALARRLARPRGRLSVGNWLRRILGDPVKVALLLEWGRPLPEGPAALAARIKALPLRHAGPMSLDRAISSAGGIEGRALSPELELRARPGVFAAGEMLDWEAPTGGYLLTACLATGQQAGQAAARRLDQALSAAR